MDAGAAGKTFPSYEFHVERGKIREFADAIGDPNPIYRDPDYAAEMGFAGILAPPTMLRTFLYEPKAASEALKVKDWSYIVHGEQEFTWHRPVQPGDVVDSAATIASVEVKRGRTYVTVELEATRGDERVLSGRALLLMPGAA